MSKNSSPEMDDVRTAPPLDIGLKKSGLPKHVKAFDITPQNKTMPSSSSKPVIVGNRTIVKDPMMTSNDTVSSLEPVAKIKKTVTPKVVIAPLHNDVVPESAEDALSTDQPELKVDEVSAEVPITTPEVDERESTTPQQPEPAKPEQPVPVKEAMPAIDEDAEAMKKSTEPKAEEIEKQNAKKRMLEAEALIASKQYFVPINAVKKRKSMRIVLWAVVVLVVAVIGAAALLDAGIVDVVPAPTNFIK